MVSNWLYLASILKDAPTPKILRLDDEEEFEGGEDEEKLDTKSQSNQESNRPKRVRRKLKKSALNDINQSEHSRRFDDSSLELDSED